MFGLQLDNFHLFDSVMDHKKEMYNDLKRALESMKYIDESKTPKNRIFYAMYLLETRQLSNPSVIQVRKLKT